jgi:hypothetical protein
MSLKKAAEMENAQVINYRLGDWSSLHNPLPHLTG